METTEVSIKKPFTVYLTKEYPMPIIKFSRLIYICINVLFTT